MAKSDGNYKTMQRHNMKYIHLDGQCQSIGLSEYGKSKSA